MSNYGEYVWKRLQTVSAEDCWGIVTGEVRSLYECWKQYRKKTDPKPARIYVSKAVILLCTVAKHNRDADLLQNMVYDAKGISDEAVAQALKEAEECREEIPDYAIDCHTEKGRRQGKTKKDFWGEEQLALFNKHPSVLT